MKRFLRKSAVILVCLCLLLTAAAPAFAADTTALRSAVTGSARYMVKTVSSPQCANIGGEWAVIGLARSGCAVPEGYFEDYYAAVEHYVKSCKGVLHAKKYTEYSRVITALAAIGRDPSDVGGYDLLMPLGNYEQTVWQGLNGPIWALIALDSGNFEIPQNPAAKTQATRQMYVDRILNAQLADGGWALGGTGGTMAADPDMTGMALQALAKYTDQQPVAVAVEKALTCLSGLQDAKGGYASWGTTNSESCVQVLVALCELGIGTEDPRFVKNGCTLLDNLLTFRKADGSFAHVAGGDSNQMSTEQGFYGIVAALRAAEDKSSLYRMGDAAAADTGSAAVSGAGLAGKDPAVQPVPVTKPGTHFSDVTDADSIAAVEALAAREIINGIGDGSFAPQRSMTRAEFAAIVVRALGLTPKANGRFTDVPAAAWYAPYVGTANDFGLVNGVSDTRFNPGGTITRQEAAVMTARAARLCGMDTSMTDAAVRDMLAQFGDYPTVAAWAKNDVAFCYAADILDQTAADIVPTAPILRCEVARMLCNLLRGAKLL